MATRLPNRRRKASARHRLWPLWLGLCILVALSILPFNRVSADGDTSSDCPGTGGGSGECYVENGDCDPNKTYPYTSAWTWKSHGDATAENTSDTVCSGAELTASTYVVNLNVTPGKKERDKYKCEDGTEYKLTPPEQADAAYLATAYRWADNSSSIITVTTSTTLLLEVEITCTDPDVGGPSTWVALCSVVVEVNTVNQVIKTGTTDNSAVIALGDSVYLEAKPSVSGESLDCLAWHKRKQNADGTWPSTWASASATAQPSEPGFYQWRARNGEHDTGATFALTAVGIDQIQISVNGSWSDQTGNSIVVLKGSQYTFMATPDPSSASWPSGKPTWDSSFLGMSRSDNGDQTTVTFTGEYDGRYLKAACGTSEKQVDIDAIVPQIRLVKYEKYDIYDKKDWWGTDDGSGGQGDAIGCFRKGTATSVKIKLYHAKQLSYDTSVEIQGDVHWLDEYITGDDYAATTATIGTSWATEHPVTSESTAQAAIKDDYDVDMQFQYRMPTGTNDWTCVGNSDNMRYYLIWDDFACSAADFIDSRIAYLVDLAEGETTTGGIADELGPDLMSNDRFGTSSIFKDPPDISVWEPLDNDLKGGDCGTLSTLMKWSLELLGVTGAEVRFVYPRHASWAGLWSTVESGVEELRIPGQYQTRLGFMIGNSPYHNKYEGCCFFNNKWWMGGYGSSESSAYDVLMTVSNPNDENGETRQAWFDHAYYFVPYPAGMP